MIMTILDIKNKERIQKEEDFVYCPKMNNSIKKINDKFPDGVENNYISKVLMITEKEVVALYESALTKIRKYLKL
jgi:hypothetical protein